MRISDWSSDVCSSDLRVLKPNYGNGGRNVWRVQLAAAGDDPALETSVEVQEARQGSEPERISLAEFLNRWVPFLNDGGVLIDQAYQPQSSEGMVRCYVCGHRVVGFGHNLITALMTPTSIDKMSSTPQPVGRVMFGPEVASPQGLCARQRFGGHNENTGYATSLRRAMGSLGVRKTPGGNRFDLCH